MLIGLAMGTLLAAFYFFFSARGDKEQIKSLIVPAFIVGLFDTISGFYMSFAWPMTTYGVAFNMLFGDPLLLFGLILIMSAVLIQKDMHLGLLPLLALILGVYVLVEAYSMVQLNLETGSHLVGALGLYLFDGVGAVLTPILYIKPTSATGKMLYYIEWIILGIGTIFGLYLGYTAINGHLASPP